MQQAYVTGYITAVQVRYATLFAAAAIIDATLAASLRYDVIFSPPMFDAARLIFRCRRHAFTTATALSFTLAIFITREV